MSIDIKDIINDHLRVTEMLLNDIINIEKICSIALSTIKNGNTILLCGNGGSASDSIHISSEITGKFEKERKALPAISLATNQADLTAIANDFGFEYIFSRQIEGIGRKGDLLVAISTSGNSKNVIKAIEAAMLKEIQIIIFTGENGGQMDKFDCTKLKIQSKNVARIQEAHILVGHIISKYIEENI
tara:strand:+ start:1652 stop:2212 length:561 start_codon:yes stop_codon:yes gene_type:complete